MKALKLNKDLNYNFENYKARIERGDFGYYDFSIEKIKDIADLDSRKDIADTDNINTLVQTLFPKHVIVNGEYIQFMMIAVDANGKPKQSPSYVYIQFSGFLLSPKSVNGASFINLLSEEIKDLFVSNNISYSSTWEGLFDESKERSIVYKRLTTECIRRTNEPEMAAKLKAARDSGIEGASEEILTKISDDVKAEEGASYGEDTNRPVS